MKNLLNSIYEDHGCAAYVLACIFILAFAFGIWCLGAWFVMLLWNAVICGLWVVAPALTFWKAFGLILLVRLLFGGFRIGGSSKND